MNVGRMLGGPKDGEHLAFDGPVLRRHMRRAASLWRDGTGDDVPVESTVYTFHRLRVGERLYGFWLTPVGALYTDLGAASYTNAMLSLIDADPAENEKIRIR